jgi:hypothetical protein
MAKKKKSKLKKALKILGAGAALAGLGRAFMNRNARASTNADAIKAMTQDSAYSLDQMPDGVEVLKRNMDVPINLGRMTGQGDMGGATGQNIRAAYAQKMRNAVTGVDGSPGILNPFSSRVITGGGRGRTFKKGGTVKKANRSKKK